MPHHSQPQSGNAGRHSLRGVRRLSSMAGRNLIGRPTDRPPMNVKRRPFFTDPPTSH